MAVMHPEDIKNYKHTYSELCLYNALKEQLPPKYHVFFSVRWFETTDGKREDSECDFLVFDPSFGFLTIECKGGKNVEIENNHWVITENDSEGNYTRRELKKSPFFQAEQSMRYFYNYFSDEFYQSFNGVYGFAVSFPMFQVDEKIENAADKSLIIDIRDMACLSKKINDIFHYWRIRRNNTVPFSTDQKNKFISAVNKRISLSAAAGALIPLKAKEIEKINIIQDSVIDLLSNYNQIRFVGGAGTGKTFMAIKKIKKQLPTQKKILYTCKSYELSNFVKDIIEDENVTCLDFYSLLQKIFGEKIEDYSSIFDAISGMDFEKYDMIVVDEAQDFSVDEALSVRYMMKSQTDSSLYVFLDKDQDIFETNTDSAFSIETEPYILRYNIRNTGEIYAYAQRQTDLGKDTVANSVLGVVPELRQCKRKMQVISEVSSIVNRLVQKECVSLKSIVLLSDVSIEESEFAGEKFIGQYKIQLVSDKEEKDGIQYRTIKEFKGLESDVIIYLKHENIAERKDDSKNMNKEDYVAYTRARYYLYVVDIV